MNDLFDLARRLGSSAHWLVKAGVNAANDGNAPVALEAADMVSDLHKQVVDACKGLEPEQRKDVLAVFDGELNGK